MITIFNRRELAITLSMEQQAHIRDILDGNQIDYSVKAQNTNGGSRSRSGSFGLNTEYLYEYYIYVHKNDYDKAIYLIGRVR